MIINPASSTTFIDPYARDENNYYIVYDRNDRIGKKSFHCAVTKPNNQRSNFSPRPKKSRALSTPFTSTCALRQYRLALAATYEYTQLFGGTKAQALAAEVTSVNRINGIYQLEAGITLQLISNNDEIICDYAGCPSSPSGVQPYTSGVVSPPPPAPTLLTQNQNNLPLIIGADSYDIGHVVDYNANSYSSDGKAIVGSVCNPLYSANAATSSPQPFSDSFDVDFFAHEVGHQFGGNHTQNNACQQSADTAVEPGSGSTILAYAGICAPNVQNVSGPYFHNVTLKEFAAYVTTPASDGGNCSTNVSIFPAPIISPVVTSATLPINTPFALTATATAIAPGAVLTYGWEETDATSSTQPPLSDSAAGPNFRSFNPTTSPTRYFPNLSDLSSSAASGVQPHWEVLPSVNRNFTFAATVRNNTRGGSCNAYANYTLTMSGADDSSFAVTVPNNPGIYWPVGTVKQITWNVAGTYSITPTVNILLSTDGGLTYPTVIASGVTNNGTYSWTIPNTNPNIISAKCRVMVIAASNTFSAFFNISGHNFAIANPTLTTAVRIQSKSSSSSAFIYFTGIPPEWLSGTFSLIGYPNAEVTIDPTMNNRFIISGLPPSAISEASVMIIIGGIRTSTNSISIPGLLG